MNCKLLLVSAALGALLAGCASTGEESGDGGFLQISDEEPTIQTTIAARKLDQWPYEKSKMTFTLVNRDLAAPGAEQSGWKNIIENGIRTGLQAKGLTPVPEKGRIEVTYGVVTKSGSSDNAELMFDSMGLTTGETSHRANSSVNIIIKDAASGSELWSGVGTVLSNRPLETDAQKQRGVGGVVASLIDKLPEAR